MSIYNKSKFLDKRRVLRAGQTTTEELLWYRLRRNQLDGYHFFRQYGVGPYILDFYCAKLRLAIELDGGHHDETDVIEYDKERELYLSGNDITTIRFKNQEVLNNIEKVIMRIRARFPLKVRGTKGGLSL